MDRKVGRCLIVTVALLLGLTPLIHADDVINAYNSTSLPTLMQSGEFEVLDQADSSEISCAGWIGGFLNPCSGFGSAPQPATGTFELQLEFPNPPANSEMVSGTLSLELGILFPSTFASTQSAPIDSSSFYFSAAAEFSPATQVTITEISSPTYSVDYNTFLQPCLDLSDCSINLPETFFGTNFESPITIEGAASLSLGDGSVLALDSGSNADTVFDVNSELFPVTLTGQLFAVFTTPPPPPEGGNGGGGTGPTSVGGAGGSGSSTQQTPEPATLILFATGLLGTLLYGMRRKHAV